MLHLRALARSHAAHLGHRCSASLASSGPHAALTECVGTSHKAGGWGSLLKEQGGAASHLTFMLNGRRDEDKQGGGASRPFATGPVVLNAAGQEGSTFNNPDLTAKEARSAMGGPGGGADPTTGGSGGYALLGAAHAGLAVACFMGPATVANFFFPGAALPQGFQSQALVKLLGCSAGVGAAASLGLKSLTDGGAVASPTAQRLQLGLMGFSGGAIALHALYSPSISTASLLAGAATMGLTFLVPYTHYAKTNGGLKPGQALASYFGAVPDHFKITGLQSGLYSLLTPVLALAGAAYLLAPGSSLASVFGFAKSVDTFFWWQCIGGGLMTVAPAVTYSLKKLSDEGRLADPAAKILNAGVIAAAVGHLAVLGPMVAANQGGPALPWLAGAWATALLAGGMGLLGRGAAKAAA